jgi:hypothetical protein
MSTRIYYKGRNTKPKLPTLQVNNMERRMKSKSKSKMLTRITKKSYEPKKATNYPSLALKGGFPAPSFLPSDTTPLTPKHR